MSKGVIYVAYTQKYIDEALFSIASLKKHNKELPVTLFSDIKVENSLLDKNILISNNNKRSKGNYNFLSLIDSPYAKTLYLDTDTYINYNITDMFDILTKYDIGLIQDFARKRKKYSDNIPEYKSIPYGFSEFNGGVILFNNNDTFKQFFNLWVHYYKKYFNICKGYNQPTLRVALWKSNIKIHTFPLEYNRRSKENREKGGPEHIVTRIYHAHKIPEMLKNNKNDLDYYFHYV